MLDGTTEVGGIIAQMMLNAPTLGGLLLLVISLYRNNEILRNDKEEQLDKLRDEKNEEIRRLQGHNDKLMSWCRRGWDDEPPLPE